MFLSERTMQTIILVLGMFIGKASVAAHSLKNGFPNNCEKFFYKKSKPSMRNNMIMGNDYVYICQVYKNKARYATLYDQSKRIPRYSAYILTKGEKKGKRLSSWFLEPQLAEKNLGYSMNTEAETKKEIKKKIKNIDEDTLMKGISNSQATNHDYRYSTWDRGHLNPSFYQNGDDRTATFTLTNAVPQDPCLNRLYWKEAEEDAKKYMDENCDGTAYFITGAVPSFGSYINYRVNIPDRMYTAACCDNGHTESFSFGYWADNKAEKETFITFDHVNYIKLDVQVQRFFDNNECNSDGESSKAAVESLKNNNIDRMEDREMSDADAYNKNYPFFFSQQYHA